MFSVVRRRNRGILIAAGLIFLFGIADLLRIASLTTLFGTTAHNTLRDTSGFLFFIIWAGAVYAQDSYSIFGSLVGFLVIGDILPDTWIPPVSVLIILVLVYLLVLKSKGQLRNQ